MKTGAEIEIKLFDVTAKEDSLPQCGQIQSFVSLAQLKEEGLEQPDCATLEENFFVLDGAMQPFPDAPVGRSWGLWSSEMSDADCRYTAPPRLRLDFAKGHSSVGLTLRFDARNNDWCRYLKATWFDSKGNILSVMDFYPTQPVFFLKNKVEAYHGIELEFFESDKPYRYMKLTGIDYGLLLVLGGTDLTSAELLEEADFAGGSLSVNTLDFSVYSETQQYSPLNPNGIFSTLQQKQRVYAYALLDGQRQYMGGFFLDRWESGRKGDIRLSAVDAVGLMDNARFMGGIYEGTTAVEVLDAIFAVCGAGYSLEPELAGKRLWGHIKVCSAREALRQAAFAIGGVVDASRSEMVRISRLPERPSRLIDSNRKFVGQSLKQKRAVTGIELTAHSFVKSEEDTTVFVAELETGEYDILLNEPACELAATNAQIVDAGVNHLRLKLTQPARATVTGKRYKDAKRLLYRRLSEETPNLADDRVKVETATLVSGQNAQEVLERLCMYYGYGYESELELPLGAEHIADMIAVQSAQGDSLKGLVERIELDLTGGCVARLTICARKIETARFDFTGELYAGERQGVI